MLSKNALESSVEAAFRSWTNGGYTADKSLEKQDFKHAAAMAIAGLSDHAWKSLTSDHASSAALVVTKNPYGSERSTAADILARSIAFGASVRLASTEENRGAEVARALYPTAYDNYAQPVRPEVLRLVTSRFDTFDFEHIFGVPFHSSMVMSAGEAESRFDLSPTTITSIWEQGRSPLTRSRALAYYGTDFTRDLLGDSEQFDWFRTERAFGIQRLASGIMAFALRHPSLRDGKPTVLINGHFPGLTEVFAPRCHVIEVSLGASTLSEFKYWVVGHDMRPEHCVPGSVRRDAKEGRLLRSVSRNYVSSKMNVAHCSDGALANLCERARLGLEVQDSVLGQILAQAGYDATEVKSLAFAGTLQGQSSTVLNDSSRDDPTLEAQRIIRLSPPIFEHTEGVTAKIYTDWVEGLSASRFDTKNFSRHNQSVRPLRREPLLVAALNYDKDSGEELISKGSVAVVSLAGGTGGRLAGYGAPESDEGRQKPFLRFLPYSDGWISSLDVRQAHLEHIASAGTIPHAVLCSSTSKDGAERWRREWVEATANFDLTIFEQRGVYRLDSSLVQHMTNARDWPTAVLREESGNPVLKPPGHLGGLTALIRNGIIEKWKNQGVEVVAFANGDDVGFRLEPAVVGLFTQGAGIDAVLVTVHQSFRGSHSVTGTRVCEVYEKGAWRAVPVEEKSIPVKSELEKEYVNTNQLYISVKSILRLVPTAESIEELVKSLPVYAEEKSVPMSNGAPAEAIQFYQVMGDVLRLLHNVEVVRLADRTDDAQVGSFLSVKEPSDLERARQLYAELQRSERYTVPSSLLNRRT